MREILFRGKRADNGEWVYGDLSKWSNGYFISLQSQNIKARTHIEVYPETVGQYTGLKDKNGTEIFEGDIVQTNKFFLPVGLNAKYVIEYDVEIACFIGTMQKGYVKHFTTFQNDSDQFEVIGNIHDNPELLNAEGVR